MTVEYVIVVLWEHAIDFLDKNHTKTSEFRSLTFDTEL